MVFLSTLFQIHQHLLTKFLHLAVNGRVFPSRQVIFLLVVTASTAYACFVRLLPYSFCY